MYNPLPRNINTALFHNSSTLVPYKCNFYKEIHCNLTINSLYFT